MSLSFQQVATAALQLKPDERADLADTLWGSIDTPAGVAKAWDAEIARRIAELESGAVDTAPAMAVVTQLCATLK